MNISFLSENELREVPGKPPNTFIAGIVRFMGVKKIWKNKRNKF